MTESTPAAEPQESAFALAEKNRRRSLGVALNWYTAPERGLTITPIHFPMPDEPEPGSAVMSGSCSCGGTYVVGTDAVVQKPETEEEAALRCSSPGKHPVKKHYVRDPNCQATTYERALELWEGRPWNIGIIHGMSTGIVVFDVDVRANGLSSMTSLATKLSEVTDTWALGNTLSYHTSGAEGRGYHLFYRADRDDTQLWRDLRAMGENILPGIEVKWKAGMVVAAPSLHASGQAYSINSTAPIAELTPERLGDLRKALDLVRGKTPKVTGQPTAGGGGWAALAAASATYGATTGSALGGDLDWENASEEDDSSNPGYWSRQLTYFLVNGAPARTFGKGEHHDSLKPLIGALAKIVFAKGTFCQEVAAAAKSRSSDPYWVPAVYGSLCFELDAAVTVPRPWQETDLQNLRGIMRYAMAQELRGHGLEI